MEIGNQPVARIDELAQAWALTAPDRPALVEGGETWTYRQLEAAIVQAAAWLRKLGVRPGDRVLLVAENCRAYVALLFATARLDAWPVLVNARLSASEIEVIRAHAEARRVVITAGATPRAAAQARQLGAATADAGMLGTLAVTPIHEAASPEALEAIPAERVAAVLYTSGTTGRPRGVMLTHRGLLFAARAAAEIRAFTPADRLLGVLPMTHSSGVSLVLLAALTGGAAVHLSHRFDPVSLLRALEEQGLTVFIGAPAMFAQLLDYAKFRSLPPPRLPALRLVSSCSSPLFPPVKSGMEQLFGQVLHNGYGITECSPGIAATRINEPRSDLSVGRPYPGLELKLVASNGQPAAPSEAGELWLRGPNVMKGYYRAADETAAVLDGNGWFKTGDLVKIADGNLFLLGRTKELIIRFGFNVYPSEIEELLESHPDVERAAVIGQRVSDVEGGEKIIAFVCLSLGASASPAELRAFLDARLTHYKRPSEILPISEWPLTPTGKIKKDELARLLLDQPATA
ncbi:MAG: class I adenylate-forming enzyme family protein [Terriglobales bacterium]